MLSALRFALLALLLAFVSACAKPYITEPSPGAYVRVLPLPPNGTLRDILMRNSKPVGEQDPTTPFDPTVRILHLQPWQAKAVFEALTRGGTPVRSTLGTSYRLPDGSIVTYYENIIHQETSDSVGNVVIFVTAKDVPVSQLRFYVPPSAVRACPPGVGCDGGGDG